MKYICENCGETFRRSPSMIKNYVKVFCSKKCHYEYRKRTGYGCSKKWSESQNKRAEVTGIINE